MTEPIRAFALLFVGLHLLALFAYTLRWLWVAMLASALLIYSVRAEELVSPTPAEAADIATWIPFTCCRSNNCCKKVHESALLQLPKNEVKVVSTGQILPRTGWSQDKNTWRCACDNIDGKWVAHPLAHTRCVFPIPNGS